jgi:putative DNA primase/helicase
MSSEAGAVLGAHAMNSESIMRNLSQLNVMWDGGQLSSLRKTSESFSVSHVRMTIGLMVQELVLRQFHAKSGGITRGSGFFARFLVSWPDSTQGSRYYVEAPSTWYARDVFNRRIAEILRQQVPFDEKGRLTPIASVLSAEAKAAWEVFYNAIEKELGLGGELQDVRDIASKVADNAVRLAALFQYFEDGLTVISLESLTSAVNITAWHLNESRRFFAELALTEEQANLVRLDSWLIKYFKRNETKSAKLADLQRYVTPTKFRKREELKNAFAQLIAADRISLEEVGGRTCIVRINPKLLKLEG